MVLLVSRWPREFWLDPRLRQRRYAGATPRADMGLAPRVRLAGKVYLVELPVPPCTGGPTDYRHRIPIRVDPVDMEKK